MDIRTLRRCRGRVKECARGRECLVSPLEQSRSQEATVRGNARHERRATVASQTFSGKLAGAAAHVGAMN
jgi:hypothetical protein